MKYELLKAIHYYGQKAIVTKSCNVKSEVIKEGSVVILSGTTLSIIEDFDLNFKIILKKLSDITNEDCIKFCDSIPSLLEVYKSPEAKINYVKSYVGCILKNNSLFDYKSVEVFRSLGYAIDILENLYVVQ